MLAKSIFTIGITGHRDINKNSIKYLEEHLDSLFKMVRSRIPATKIRLISLMAEGADRLAAQIAIENGIGIDAILPMPNHLYYKDFSDKSKIELGNILENDLVKLKELPLPSGISETNLKEPEFRKLIYARAGKFMASNSDLLIALWDGKESDKIGGTYHIIKNTVQNINWVSELNEQLKDTSYYKSSLRDHKSSIVYHIPTSREGQSSNVFLAKQPSYIVRSDNENDAITHIYNRPKDLDIIFSQLNEYENDIQRVDKKPSFSKSTLLEFKRLSFQLPQELEEYLSEIENHFNSADYLAVKFQKASDNSFKLIAILAFFLGTIFLIYAKLFSNSLILVLYTIVFLVGYLSYRKFRKRKILDKHVKYRVLAESLRVKFFFALSGIQNFIDGYTVEHFLKLNEHKNFRVLSSFIRNSDNLFINESNEKLKERIKSALDQWVSSQKEYFETKSTVNKRKIKRLERINICVIFFGLALVVCLVTLPSNVKYFQILDGLVVKNLLTFFVGFLPMTVATYEHYSIKMAVSERAWQYETMSNIFSRATTLLKESSDLSECQEILKALGEEAIAENMNWMVLRIQRELQPATGG